MIVQVVKRRSVSWRHRKRLWKYRSELLRSKIALVKLKQCTVEETTDSVKARREDALG
jgi:hypothetical protein